ncbi:MAG: RNA polymerase sigma factor, partial [Flavobacteriaceae bacterium]
MLLAQDQQFKDAYSAFEDRLFRIAKRLLISEDEAKDATQEVVIKLWQMPKKQLQQLKSLEAYAVTMTKNYCFDRLKSKHAQQDFLDDSFIQRADSQSLNKQLDRSDALQWVGKLMDGLPEKERLILQLRDFE